MIRDRVAVVFGFILGLVFGLGLVTFTLGLINATVDKLPTLLGSIIGLIILIVITGFLILKIRPISSLIAGIIVGALVNMILAHIGTEIIVGFIGLLGI